MTKGRKTVSGDASHQLRQFEREVMGVEVSQVRDDAVAEAFAVALFFAALFAHVMSSIPLRLAMNLVTRRPSRRYLS